MRPMYLPDVENFVSYDERGESIQQMKSENLPIPQILHLFTYKAERNRYLSLYTEAVMRGESPLSPGQRELIAAFTSRRNECPFWIGSHAAVAAELLGNRALVEAVLEDYRTAPISKQEKTLFGLIEKIVQQSNQITQADIEQARAAGWTDEAIYDAITVCALFQFYNTWVDATGVSDLPTEAYQMSGKRMARNGYATSEERKREMGM